MTDKTLNTTNIGKLPDKPLNEKRRCNPNDITEGYYPEKDVKEAVSKLKEELRIVDGGPDIRNFVHYLKLKIDKIFGRFE